jgi:uncharacterized membrane protein YccF (DUF307 family)
MYFSIFQLGSDANYLTFKPVTLVPYDNNLINPDIMSKKQVRIFLTADMWTNISLLILTGLIILLCFSSCG